MQIYDDIIDTALDEQERILKAKGMDPEVNDKVKLDYDYKAAHVRILQAQKDKNRLLIEMGQFANRMVEIDSNEAMYYTVRAVLKILHDELTEKQYEKIKDSMTVLINKSVTDLKSFVTSDTNRE